MENGPEFFLSVKFVSAAVCLGSLENILLICSFNS